MSLRFVAVTCPIVRYFFTYATLIWGISCPRDMSHKFLLIEPHGHVAGRKRCKDAKPLMYHRIIVLFRWIIASSSCYLAEFTKKNPQTRNDFLRTTPATTLI